MRFAAMRILNFKNSDLPNVKHYTYSYISENNLIAFPDRK